MCEEQEKAFITFIKTFYKPRKNFTRREVIEVLMKEAGTTRIAPGRTIDDWIKSAVIRGELEEPAPFEYSWKI